MLLIFLPGSQICPQKPLTALIVCLLSGVCLVLVIGFRLRVLVTHIPCVCMSTFPKAKGRVRGGLMEKFFTYGLYLQG